MPNTKREYTGDQEAWEIFVGQLTPSEFLASETASAESAVDKYLTKDGRLMRLHLPG